MSVENTHFGAAAIAWALRDCNSIFFIGVGGISMASLAQLSLARGLRVGGSDRTESALTQRLEREGITVFYQHDAAHIEGYGAVVYTVAIGEDNPEYLAAKQKGLPLFSRADYLGYLMTDFRERVGISGMHGKTTTTAMCAQIFLAAVDPTVMCGAALPSLQNTPCRIGEAREHFVFEACEYMDSFLDFSPTLAVILNVGLDHVDYFHSIEQIRASFLRFAEIAETAPNGRVLYNADDEQVQLALRELRGERHSFGVYSPAEFTAQNVDRAGGRIAFDFCRAGEFLCRLELGAVGEHNVYNALAAASAAYLCGFSAEVIQTGLAAFRGAARRMEYRGELPTGAVVYDDYAHHPDEIRATLEGASHMGYERLICVYQPHTYSRTAGLLQEFLQAFHAADRVIFADIYAAREQNVFGVSSQTLADGIGARASYGGSFPTIAQTLLRETRKGDLVIVMGAGDINKIYDLLKLSEK